MFNRGDSVQLLKDAQFVNGNKVPAGFIGQELCVKDIKNNGYILSKGMDMPAIGVAIPEAYVTIYENVFLAQIDPYYISLNEDVAVHLFPENNAQIIKIAPKMSLFKIVNEKNGWGKIEVGNGWVKIDETAMLIIKND